MKDRDARLYKYWLGHPRMTLQNIGNVFKIKHRQQVFMIIKREKELAGVHGTIGRALCNSHGVNHRASKPGGRNDFTYR